MVQGISIMPNPTTTLTHPDHVACRNLPYRPIAVTASRSSRLLYKVRAAVISKAGHWAHLGGARTGFLSLLDHESTILAPFLDSPRTALTTRELYS